MSWSILGGADLPWKLLPHRGHFFERALIPIPDPSRKTRSVIWRHKAGDSLPLPRGLRTSHAKRQGFVLRPVCVQRHRNGARDGQFPFLLVDVDDGDENRAVPLPGDATSLSLSYLLSCVESRRYSSQRGRRCFRGMGSPKPALQFHGLISGMLFRF